MPISIACTVHNTCDLEGRVLTQEACQCVPEILQDVREEIDTFSIIHYIAGLHVGNVLGITRRIHNTTSTYEQNEKENEKTHGFGSVERT